MLSLRVRDLYSFSELRDGRDNLLACILERLPDVLTPAGRSKRRLAAFVFLAAALCGSNGKLYAQEGTWQLSASAGYAFLALRDVDDDNRKDIEGWNRVGYALGPLESVKRSPFFSGRLSYRHSREFGTALSFLYFSKEVTASYATAEDELSISRSVGGTEFSLGIAYYPAFRPYFLEWYIQIDATYLLARARAGAYGTKTTKTEGEAVTDVVFDTEAVFTKSRLNVSVRLGADVPVASPLLLRIEGAYRFAQLGKLDGDVRRFGVTRVETTTIEFNYSGFMLSAGVGLAF